MRFHSCIDKKNWWRFNLESEGVYGTTVKQETFFVLMPILQIWKGFLHPWWELKPTEEMTEIQRTDWNEQMDRETDGDKFCKMQKKENKNLPKKKEKDGRSLSSHQA